MKTIDHHEELRIIQETIESTTGIRLAPTDEPILDGISTVVYRLRPSGRPDRPASRIPAAHQNIALALGCSPVTVELGDVVEVSRPKVAGDDRVVHLRPLLEDVAAGSGPVTAVVGRRQDGRPHVIDFASDPHWLVAGSTGSGKSVFLLGVVLGLVFRYPPSRLQLYLADHKEDFTFLDGLPHLATPVVRSREDYDALLSEHRAILAARKSLRWADERSQWPTLVTVVDEFHGFGDPQSLQDLVSEGRDCRMHYILATQHPVKDIVDTTVKSNLVLRVALKVPNGGASKLIIDCPDAKSLLGHGDCLVSSSLGMHRVQAPWVRSPEECADSEIARVMELISCGPDAIAGRSRPPATSSPGQGGPHVHRQKTSGRRDAHSRRGGPAAHRLEANCQDVSGDRSLPADNLLNRYQIGGLHP
jgi:DNA segregation ATPase FtsK/SpoIIIE-like protein